MAQYIAFAPNIKVIGESVMAFVNALPAFKDTMLEILAKNGIKNVVIGEWYDQKNMLNAYKDVGEQFGSNTLFAIGKAIPENSVFPPNVTDLRSALEIIDVAYHMNHTEGDIGYYKLLEFNEHLRIAVMECKNPYPSDFDRGILTAMARKFKPDDSVVVKVEVDGNKPTRLNGAESCHYTISW